LDNFGLFHLGLLLVEEFGDLVNDDEAGSGLALDGEDGLRDDTCEKDGLRHHEKP